MFIFCLCPDRSSLDSVLRPFFGVQNASLSVRTGHVGMKIHSVPFLWVFISETRFSSKNAQMLDQKQQRRKQQGLWRLKVCIYIYIYECLGREVLLLLWPIPTAFIPTEPPRSLHPNALTHGPESPSPRPGTRSRLTSAAPGRPRPPRVETETRTV